MAVTVRMRSVARPYTVHPASVKHRGECAQGVSFGLGVSSVFRRRSVWSPEGALAAWGQGAGGQVGVATACSPRPCEHLPWLLTPPVERGRQCGPKHTPLRVKRGGTRSISTPGTTV